MSLVKEVESIIAAPYNVVRGEQFIALGLAVGGAYLTHKYTNSWGGAIGVAWAICYVASMQKMVATVHAPSTAAGKAAAEARSVSNELYSLAP